MLDDKGPNDNGLLVLVSTVMTTTNAKEMFTILFSLLPKASAAAV